MCIVRLVSHCPETDTRRPLVPLIGPTIETFDISAEKGGKFNIPIFQSAPANSLTHQTNG